MRIVSLLPSATEIVCALGLSDGLVGVTHACDYPAPVVAGLPRVTATRVPVGGDAEEIDNAVRALQEQGQSLYTIDQDLLRTLQPDLILTQGLCDVCAVNHATVVAAVDALGPGTTVLDLAPKSLADILATFRQVAQAAGADDAGERLALSVQACWDAIREKAATAPHRPRTLLLGWTAPPFSAGHWNPELIALAGGTPAPWDIVGEPAHTLTWDDAWAFAPEALVLAPCGLDIERTEEAALALGEIPGWYDLPCVRNADCFSVDGAAYFNRPGPRLAESARILATILNPEIFTEMIPPYSVRMFPTTLLSPPKAPNS